MNESEKIKAISRYLGAVYLLITLFLAGASFRLDFLSLVCGREDFILQWGQWLFLVMAISVSIILFLEGKGDPVSRRIFPFLFSLFFIWVLLEELNYGQKIFHFPSPYYFQMENAHRVTNLHNLPILDNASEVASLSILVIWGIILPIGLRFFKPVGELSMKWRFPIPGIVCAIGCACGLFLEMYFRHLLQGYDAKSGEVLELYLYFTFFSGVLLSRERWSGAHSPA